MLTYVVTKTLFSLIISLNNFLFLGGLTLLALLSLIMDAFRIGQYVGFQPCVSAVLVVYPVIHATHTMAQVSAQSRFNF